MKKICLVLFALMVCINSYGQAWDNSKPDDRFTFGLRVGANMSTFAGGQWDDYLEIKSRWGFHAGFNVDVNIVKSFAIETGLYYTVKGANMGYIYRDEGKLTYLQLPILALYRLPVAEYEYERNAPWKPRKNQEEVILFVDVILPKKIKHIQNLVQSKKTKVKKVIY